MAYPGWVKDALDELKKYYGYGLKISTTRCDECGWDAGFYFDAGAVRYDPCCMCRVDGTKTRESSEAELVEAIMRWPEGWFADKIYEGRAVELEKELYRGAWEPLPPEAKPPQKKRKSKPKQGELLF